MKKRFLSFALVICLLCGLIPQLVFGASAASYSGTCGSRLTWTLNTNTGLLQISGTGTMRDWTNESSVPWVNYRHYIKKVEIGSGVTSIGDYAFARCSYLTEVAIPSSVTTIGDHAFECCYISEVTIPNGVTIIGDYAFGNCSSLTDVTIGTGVTSIGEGAFIECYNLSSVTIPDSVETIGSRAFMFCEWLTEVTIGEGVASIGCNAFQYCFSLEKVNYTGTEKMWKEMAVEQGNDALFNAVLYYVPDENIKWEFYFSTGLLRISGTGAMPDWTSDSSVPWDSYRCYIRAVEIGSGVTSIGSNAFSCCYKLTNVVIPDSVTSIGNWAFSGCCDLTNVIIGNGVTTIGKFAFHACSSLTNVVIPDSVKTIGRRAFMFCEWLTEVTIGSGVTFIDYSAFDYCPSLKKVYYNGTEEMWNEIAIMNYNDALTDATITYKETNSGNNSGGGSGGGWVDVGIDLPLLSREKIFLINP